MRRYSRGMPSGVIDSPTGQRFAFDALEVESAAPDTGPLRLRLRGEATDGRHWLLDFAAATPPLRAPARLTHAVVEASGRAEAPALWQIQSDQGRFELGAVRAFIHQDVTRLAAAAVPPRPVPLGKRLFWRAVFVLLGMRAGRRWLERRAAGG
mgnify:CR=1 FL=1